MAQHLSIFVENKPGKIEAITKVLADNNINLMGIAIASRGEFGIVKLLPDDIGKACDVLKKHNFTVHRRNAAIIIVDDKPGSLHNVLILLSTNKINIEDCYGFVLADKKRAAIVLEIAQSIESEKVLKEHHIKLLTNDDMHTIFNRKA
jgi:hypothetical protein